MSDVNADHIKYETILSLIKTGDMDLNRAENIVGAKLPKEWITEHLSSKSTGFYVKKGNRLVPDYKGWAEYMVMEYNYFSTQSGGYIYDKSIGHYRTISVLEVESILLSSSSCKADPTHFNMFIKELNAYAFRDNHFKNKEHKINLKNGILCLKSKKLIPHSPEYFFTYVLPIEYKDDAKCDEWLLFLDRIFPDSTEYKIICAEIFGYILYGGDQWLHKSFVLFGEGRNGKSTFLHILQRLLGRENYSSVSLSNLNKPFSVVNLDGKLANIVGETPSDKINAEVFKEATSGGTLTGSKKFKDEYDFECHARFIFACNEMPKFGENTIGMNERLYFIPFKKYFSKDERRSDIKQVLEGELSGILNWAISGLELLLEDKYLPETEATTLLMDEYKEESDSVYAWAKEFLAFDKDALRPLKSRELYNHYKTSTIDGGRHPLSDRKFYKSLLKYLRSMSWFDENQMYDKNNRYYKSIFLKQSSTNAMLPSYLQ